MAKIKGKFIKGAAVEGAKAYRLALNLGDSFGGYPFKNNGYIDSNGQVVYMPEKHHTDIIAIDKLVDFNGYCVQHFDINYTDYPKILFFSGNSLDSFISGLTVTELGGKDKLTASEIKDLAANVVGATHVAFNSDYESGEDDHVYVNDGTYYLELDVKKAEQTFVNFGHIGQTGHGNEIDGYMVEKNTKAILGERYNVLPLTALGVNGKSYYFRVSVPLKVETTSGIITKTCVGYVYLNTDLVDYFEATRFSFETTEEYDRYIVLVTNFGNIRLAKLDGRYNYNSVVIDNDEGSFDLFHANTMFCHTDFIPIDALTNGLKATVDGVEKEYCVRGFGGFMGLNYRMAFYTDMDYSAFSHGKSASLSSDYYYTAEKIKAFAEDIDDRLPKAQYVIFVAETEFMQENDCDRVSVGGIWFPLHKYKTLEDGDKLAIQAVGENGITLDSFYSEHIDFMREE